jgi:hypothetical protein
MKAAIMQPYLFPYIGYFQLIATADAFVFYDDVNFIKQGWINRNRILVKNEPMLFTVPVVGISSFDTICNVKIHKRNFQIWKGKFLTTVRQSYSKAPFFASAFNLVEEVLNSDVETIADLAILSVERVCSQLGITKPFKRSSVDFASSKELDRAERLINICGQLKATEYINPIGGTELYEKDFFQQRGIKLHFIRSSDTISYSQGKNPVFVPWLSVIDVLMFAPNDQILQLLNMYTLE